MNQDKISVDDIVEELEGLKAGIEIKTAEIIYLIDETIRDFTGENDEQQPLREFGPISEELVDKTNEKLNNLFERVKHGTRPNRNIQM